MISVESTKICSCIKVTPSWALSIVPRTVFIMICRLLGLLGNQSSFVDHLPQLVLAAESDFIRDDLAVASNQNEGRKCRDSIGFENPGIAAEHHGIFEWRLFEKFLHHFPVLAGIHAENHQIA